MPTKPSSTYICLRAVPTVYTSILPDIIFRQKKTVLLTVNFRQRVFNKMAVKTN